MAHTRRARRILTAITAVAAVSCGLLVAVAIHTPAHADVNLDNALLVTTRDDFQMCVTTTPALHRRGVDADIHTGLARALATVRRHPDWRDAYGTDQLDDETVAGTCPGAKLPDRLTPRNTVAGPGLTEHPSPYRTWVYVLDDRTADSLLGPGVPSGTAMAELMRLGKDELVTVSSALLIRYSALEDTSFSVRQLTRAVGLDTTAGPARQVPSTK